MSEPTITDIEIWESIKHRTMDDLAQEIGRLCMYWSELEMAVTILLSQLLAIEEPHPKNIVLAGLDFRAKLQMLLPIGFHRKRNDGWYSELETVVNHIDNDLRNERNRIIHDYWIEMPGMDEPHRWTFRAKVVKAPPSGELKLQLATYKPFTPKEVGLLYVQVIRATERIQELEKRYTLPGISLPPVPSPNPSPGQS